MDKKEVAWQIMCSGRMIAYLVDLSNYELAFLSPEAMRLMGIKAGEELQEKVCYKMIHGRNEPCEFCMEADLMQGREFHWQFYNARLGCWVNARDRLVTIEGKEYRLEILEDPAEERKKLDQKLWRLELEKTLVKCIGLLACEEDSDVAIGEFLRTVCHYYAADRAYIIEYSGDGKTCSNTFEWCRDGVEAQMGYLQNISLELLQTCNRKFVSEGEFYISLDDFAAGREEDYRFVRMKKADSFGAVPFMQDNRVVGFLGVDNPTRCINEWILIRSVSSLARDELRKRRLSKSLELASYTDALTGLGNRRLYQERLGALQREHPDKIGIGVVDINGLKAVNDKLGHLQGDNVLLSAGEVLRELFEKNVYRVSGDQFVILAAGEQEKDFLGKITRMRERMEAGREYTVSVGAVWREGKYLLEDEISFADELMYAEKQKYYSRVIKEGRHGRVGIASQLLEDIREGRFVVYLQPQYDLQTRQVIGAEALVRKKDRDGNIILPGDFIPSCEKEGIIRHIDFFVLQTVCRKLQEWKRKGKTIRIAINFSRVTLMEPQISQSVLEVCRKYEVDPGCIKIEMTESISKMGDLALKKLLYEIAEAGFTVSLDDFGYAYSNLSLAAEYHFPEMKLDMSMVKRLEQNPRMDIIAKNSIDAINALGSCSLAEGIENEEQLKRLITFSCKMGQGFFFARPMPMEKFEKYLEGI